MLTGDGYIGISQHDFYLLVSGCSESSDPLFQPGCKQVALDAHHTHTGTYAIDLAFAIQLKKYVHASMYSTKLLCFFIGDVRSTKRNCINTN